MTPESRMCDNRVAVKSVYNIPGSEWQRTDLRRFISIIGLCFRNSTLNINKAGWQFTSLLHRYYSIIFARWCPYVFSSNTLFLGPTRVLFSEWILHWRSSFCRSHSHVQKL